MQKIYPLIGNIQHYAWGGKDYIPALLNLANSEQKPFAEWWLGTHPALPSQIIVDGNAQDFGEFLKKHPELLGEKSRRQFGDSLPYLLKILDVAEPLSIQLHPTKAEAKAGFLAENLKNIPLNAPNRTYKDQNHKPEMMLALSDFWLLHGFKTKEAMLATLNERPSLRPLAEKLQKMDLGEFYAEIMQANQKALAEWLLPIIDKNQHAFKNNDLALNNPDYWVLYSLQSMQIPLEKLDAGLICFYLFNLVNLKKGEGIFQGAGIPHAYLRGQNIELMANSDNVIRGGLTPKYVDIPALLATIDTTEITPAVMEKSNESLHLFPALVADFALWQLRLRPNQDYLHDAQEGEILLVMEGSLTLCHNEALTLKAGESAFIGAGAVFQIQAHAQGTMAVIATLP